MRLTEHFTSEEMSRSNTAIRLGLDNTCPPELIPNMLKVATAGEILRNYFDAPVRVHSCYRSEAVNKAVGGSPTSAHKSAMAMDCTVDGIGVLALCHVASEVIPDYDQIIYEFGPSGWMHIGFSNGTPRKELLTATKKKGKTVYTKGLG